MEKKICAYFFVATFFIATSIVHGNSSAPERNPSVEPIVEVDIEETKKPEAGYNFTNEVKTARLPANIVTNTQASQPSSFIGPIIFLIALPIALWILVSRRFNQKDEEKSLYYYPKTQQFNPYKTEYQKSAEDDDDVDYPKAS